MTKDGDLLFLFAKYDPACCTYQEMTKNPKWLPYLKKYVDYYATVEKEIGTKEKIMKWFEKLRFKCVVVSIDDNFSCQYTKDDLIGRRKVKTRIIHNYRSKKLVLFTPLKLSLSIYEKKLMF